MYTVFTLHEPILDDVYVNNACASIHTQVPFTIISMSIAHSAIKLHLILHNQGHAILEGKVGNRTAIMMKCSSYNFK